MVAVLGTLILLGMVLIQPSALWHGFDDPAVVALSCVAAGLAVGAVVARLLRR